MSSKSQPWTDFRTIWTQIRHCVLCWSFFFRKTLKNTANDKQVACSRAFFYDKKLGPKFNIWTAANSSRSGSGYWYPPPPKKKPALDWESPSDSLGTCLPGVAGGPGLGARRAPRLCPPHDSRLVDRLDGKEPGPIHCNGRLDRGIGMGERKPERGVVQGIFFKKK